MQHRADENQGGELDFRRRRGLFQRSQRTAQQQLIGARRGALSVRSLSNVSCWNRGQALPSGISPDRRSCAGLCLARGFSADPEENAGYMTEYVATRWYRAP